MSSLKDIFSVSRKRYILHCKPTEIETHMRKTKKNLFPRTIKPEIFKEQVGLSELSHLHTPIQGHAFKWSQNIWMTCEPLGTFWAQIWQLGFLPHSPSLPCLALSHGPLPLCNHFHSDICFFSGWISASCSLVTRTWSMQHLQLVPRSRHSEGTQRQSKQ